jgi:tRNA threonylcarbamoyladenosine biosynthesis protein TsaE
MKIISKSANDTLNIGKTMAKYLKNGNIVCLFGELGAGKTVLTKGIASGLGIKANNIISPTFLLMREYATPKIALYHFDLYRVKTHRDIFALGYEEYFYGSGLAVIEWADRLDYLLPAEYLRIELFIKSNSHRIIELKGVGRSYKNLMKVIYENIRH